MSGDFMGDRRAGLENAFFAQQDAALRRRMAESDATKEKRAALAKAAGLGDGPALDQLLALNITSATLVALSLVPLVVVAWADGSIDSNERSAVMAAAEQSGLAKDSPGHGLLTGWLAKKPTNELITAWKAYVSSLVAGMSGDARQAFQTEILGHARAVAEAAGGFLGLTNRVSTAEQAALDDLAKAFAA